MAGNDRQAIHMRIVSKIDINVRCCGDLGPDAGVDYHAGMRVQSIGRSALVTIALASPAATNADGPPAAPQPAPQSAPQSAPQASAATARVATQLELRIDFVTPLHRYSGPALVTAVDPRFVLGGKVVWVGRPGVIPLHSQQVFAIHSPARLGIHTGDRGATVCLLLTRNIRDEKTHWELTPMPPDAGCRGGG